MSMLIDRPRRLRRTPVLRRLVRETHLQPSQFIYPLFVVPGTGVRDEIEAMPGQFRLSVDELLKELDGVVRRRLGGVILFGIPEHKDDVGSGAYAPDGIVQQALRAARKAYPELLLITDVCLCEYTDHGHCGVLKEGDVDNDPTLDLLVRTAVSHAEAGADIVAPSDMMDGRVAAIRRGLDTDGFSHIPIMAYSAKYASAYYGPFREAAESAPSCGDRRGYQMDPPNVREALREVALDCAEGADIVMVKPALAYLDVIRAVREAVDVPVAAYNVSGEYSMLKAAAQRGWLDEQAAVLETLTGIRRAGADMIITYHAKEAADWLRGV